jgi:hypothetical protein
MRANIIQARDAGVSLGFFGGNYMYWPTMFLPDSNDTPNRTLAVDKTFGQDGTFAGSRYNQSEQLIVGGMWNPGHNNINGDIVVNPRKEATDAPLDHWVFANIGLQVGDVIPGLVGIEYNAFHPDFPVPGGWTELLRPQAPDFGNTSGGGFLLPDTFDGKNFNGWYEDAEAFVRNGGTLITVCDKSPIPPLNIPPPPGGWLTPGGSEACRKPISRVASRLRSSDGLGHDHLSGRQWCLGLQCRYESVALGTRRLLHWTHDSRWRQKWSRHPHSMRISMVPSMSR